MGAPEAAQGFWELREGGVGLEGQSQGYFQSSAWDTTPLPVPVGVLLRFIRVVSCMASSLSHTSLWFPFFTPISWGTELNVYFLLP